MRSSLKARMLGAAFGVGAVFGGVAWAQDASPITITGNIALTSDYMFRGISQTSGGAAVQGGFDATYDMFYVGTWASNLDFESSTIPFAPNAPMELDFYGGFRPTLGPLALDVGVVGYFYPNAKDDSWNAGICGATCFGEYDYLEGYVKGSVSPAPGLTLGVAASYSPEFFAKTGDAYYIEGNGSVAITDMLSASGAFGYQSIDDVSGAFALGDSDEYLTWNIGATLSLWGLSFDARYVDTDIDAADKIITDLYAPLENVKERGVFTIKKSL